MKIIWPHHFQQNQLFSARKRKLVAQMLALERERGKPRGSRRMRGRLAAGRRQQRFAAAAPLKRDLRAPALGRRTPFRGPLLGCADRDLEVPLLLLRAVLLQLLLYLPLQLLRRLLIWHGDHYAILIHLEVMAGVEDTLRRPRLLRRPLCVGAYVFPTFVLTVG